MECNRKKVRTVKESEFKFSNPKLVKLDFITNDDYVQKHDTAQKDIGISINNHISTIGEKEAVVELEIEIGEKSNMFPFFMCLIIGAKFKLDDEIEGTNFDNLLNINAPTLLLSYARPIISTVTAQAGMKPLNLPFFNFTK